MEAEHDTSTLEAWSEGLFCAALSFENEWSRIGTAHPSWRDSILVNVESPERMVRKVCESFEGEPFTVYDAAKRMIQMYPSEPTHVFGDGWEALLRSRQLAHTSDKPNRYWLESTSQPESAAFEPD